MSPRAQCKASCGYVQECGHTCKSKCGECRERKGDKVVHKNHGICKQVCGRKYKTCRHSCEDACHGDENCSPCSAACEVRCSHSRCSKKCHEPCSSCAEAKCASGCPHSQCTMPCAAPCDFVPCSKRCDRLLGCGHQCKYHVLRSFSTRAPRSVIHYLYLTSSQVRPYAASPVLRRGTARPADQTG